MAFASYQPTPFQPGGGGSPPPPPGGGGFGGYQPTPFQPGGNAGLSSMFGPPPSGGNRLPGGMPGGFNPRGLVDMFNVYGGGMGGAYDMGQNMGMQGFGAGAFGPQGFEGMGNLALAGMGGPFGLGGYALSNVIGDKLGSRPGAQAGAQTGLNMLMGAPAAPAAAEGLLNYLMQKFGKGGSKEQVQFGYGSGLPGTSALTAASGIEEMKRAEMRKNEINKNINRSTLNSILFGHMDQPGMGMMSGLLADGTQLGGGSGNLVDEMSGASMGWDMQNLF